MLSPEQCQDVMWKVTRENAAEVLASLSPEERTAFEWWFVARFGDRVPRPEDRRIYIGSSFKSKEAQDAFATDLQSRYGAMHRAILASREPL